MKTSCTKVTKEGQRIVVYDGGLQAPLEIGSICHYKSGGRKVASISPGIANSIHIDCHRYGGPDLFVRCDQNGLVFSESFQKLKHPGLALNYDGILDYLDLGYFSPFSMPYQGIYRLFAGNCYELEIGGAPSDLKMSIMDSVYMDYEMETVSRKVCWKSTYEKPLADYVNQELNIVKDGLEREILNCERVAILLSSGKDSVCLAKIISMLGVEDKVVAYHLESPYFGLDESLNVERIVEKYNIRLNKVQYSESDILESMESISDADIVTGNLAWSGIDRLIKNTKGSDLLISGDGAGGSNRSAKEFLDAYELDASFKRKVARIICQNFGKSVTKPLLDCGFWSNIHKGIYKRYRGYLDCGHSGNELLNIHFERMLKCGAESITHYSFLYKYPLFQYDTYKRMGMVNGTNYYAPYADPALVRALDTSGKPRREVSNYWKKKIIKEILKEEMDAGLISSRKSALAINLNWVISQIFAQGIVEFVDVIDWLEELSGRKLIHSDLIQANGDRRNRGALPRSVYRLVYHALTLYIWDRNLVVGRR